MLASSLYFSTNARRVICDGDGKVDIFWLSVNSITIFEPCFMMQLPHKSNNIAILSGGFKSTAELIGSIVSVDNGVEGRCQTTSDKMFPSNRSLFICTFIKEKVSVCIW